VGLFGGKDLEAAKRRIDELEAEVEEVRKAAGRAKARKS